MRRVAIVGTAPSWEQTPFGDPDLEVWSLNDAYRIPGFARADRWYDLHPLDKFYIVPVQADGTQPRLAAHQIPIDQYVRPDGHRDWLAVQPFKKFLHPDFATQWPAATTWPNVHPFPKKEIEAHFGMYFTSSPAWMLAHAVLEGVREIAIYGIHLSTEHEYIEQRPNFEALIGAALGFGKRSVTVANGMRIYETSQRRIALPEASPVFAGNFQYAFQPSPHRKLEPLKWELFKAQSKLQRRMQALRTVRPWWPFVTVQEPVDKGLVSRRVSVSTLVQEIEYYEAVTSDCSEQLARAGV